MSAPITAWLDEAQATVDAATEGPWSYDGYGRTGFQVNALGTIFADPLACRPDAAFIADARTRLPQAIAALRAVLDEVAAWHGDPYGQQVVRETIAAALEVQP